tara:strand:- start:73 stop:366 length:294 start_codon:yes stop_codon:yes gene_type:complete
MFIRWVIRAILLITLCVWAYEGFHAVIEWQYKIISAGELWAQINTNSLVGFQSFIEKSISPWIWWNIIFIILSGPAWAIPLALTSCLILQKLWSKHR